MDGAELWGVAWAMVATIAGGGLAIVATALYRRAAAIDIFEFDSGYNALAPQLDPRSLIKI